MDHRLSRARLNFRLLEGIDTLRVHVAVSFSAGF
jgi:hypothetical protein